MQRQPVLLHKQPLQPQAKTQPHVRQSTAQYNGSFVNVGKGKNCKPTNTFGSVAAPRTNDEIAADSACQRLGLPGVPGFRGGSVPASCLSVAMGSTSKSVDAERSTS